MKVLRIFYDTANKIIWTHGLEGTGEFPQSITDDSSQLPEGTKCIELTDPTIDLFMASDTNAIKNGELIIGEARIIVTPIPEPVRDFAAEIDTINARLNKLEKK